MKLREFNKAVMPHLTAGMLALGFEHATRGYFTRTRGKFRDVLFVDLEVASGKSFCAVIGIDVPYLSQQIGPAIGTDSSPSPAVYRHLGHVRRDGNQRWYQFCKRIPLPQAVESMLADFREEGLPWLDSFQSLGDVARDFYNRRVGPLMSGEERRPDPMSWAQYGWLLQEAGDDVGAASWLDRARAELRKPLYMTKDRRVLTEPAEGAKEIARPAQHTALARLLDTCNTGSAASEHEA
jgi:hypothetical protein